jgi:hypothetical protein
MTEAEWLAALDPKLMLTFVRQKVSERKLRLFTVACCRRIWGLLTDKRSREAVAVAERFADTLASEEERASARRAALDASNEARQAFVDHPDRGWDALCLGELSTDAADYTVYTPGLHKAAECARRAVQYAWNLSPTGVEPETEQAAQCHLLRDVFGNPFRPVLPDPDWLCWNNGTVARLAQGIYEERAFERMPILADALEDAGCADTAMLDHLRGPGPHVRGCHVLDLLIGRE